MGRYRVRVSMTLCGCEFFFFKQKTAYEIIPSLVGSEMCIRDMDYEVPACLLTCLPACLLTRFPAYLLICLPSYLLTCLPACLLC